ncbi:MAG: hypothetical protein ACJLS3_02820 [Erythrobacter sp.]
MLALVLALADLAGRMQQRRWQGALRQERRAAVSGAVPLHPQTKRALHAAAVRPEALQQGAG